MKRRVLSLFLAFALCFSSLPMPTFAEKTDVVTEQEETEVVMEQEEAEEPAEPETPSDENATEDDSDTAKDTSIDGETIDDTTDESAGDGVVGEEDEQDTEKNEEEDEAVQAVQALIDALPDEVTEENVESIGEQLAAIDEAMAELTEEQIAKLDMTRYDAICAALNGLVAVQDDAHTHYLCGEDDCNGVGEHTENGKVTFTAWYSMSSLPTVKGNYYLVNNVTLYDKTWEPADGVVLCLNGHTITADGDFQSITVGSKKTFTLCDCYDNGKITHGTDSDGNRYADYGVYVYGGTFNMYGGNITENRTLAGPGVYVYNGTFNMYGGSITNNTALRYYTEGTIGAGGGVYVEKSTFNMYNGTIEDNKGEYGGGVGIAAGSTFNMSGGTIKNNHATAGYEKYGYKGTGGGVYVGWQETFNMTGGEITGNEAAGCGDGVYVDAATNNRMGHFTVSGSAKVSDNATSNVYLPDGVTIAIGEGGLATDARIGVTTEKSPAQGSYVAIATGAANGGYTDGAFVYDQNNSAYKFQQTGDQILLVNGKLHTHPICGDSTCSEHGDNVNWMSVSTEAELKAIKAGTTAAPSYYYLLNDITLTSTWTPADNVVLCLNGKSIIADGDFNTITCRKTTFTLTDCGSTAGKITHTFGKKGSGVAVVGEGNNNDSKGFIMYGGSIAGNTVTGNGGGVNIDNSPYNKFTMYGGYITDNTADGNGGGVYSLNGDITMTGGIIDYNTAGAEGGGVHIGDGSTVDFEMTGGTITGNTAGTNGGGVYVKTSYSYIYLSGGINITGNTTNNNANNVYLSRNKTITVIGDLAKGSRIGVTVEKMPEKGNFTKVANGTEIYTLTEVDEDCFTLDAGNGYVIEKLGDNLIIKNDGDETLHHHPVCGEICTHKNADGTLQHKDVYWEAASTLSNDMPGGYYYLTQDVTLTETWQPVSGIVLDLDGHDIIMESDYKNVIEIHTRGTFTLTDCMGKNNTYGKITHEEGNTGGGIYVGSSYTTFVMYGGSITGNSGTQGVHLSDSEYPNQNKTFTMYGGKITNNTSTNYEGSGVYVGWNNAFTMMGGTISGNKTRKNGGGVFVVRNGTFTMQGGSITGNTAKDGGGVYVDNGYGGTGACIVSGDAQIAGNHKTDGTTADNVYLGTYNDNQAYIKVSGALSETADIGVSIGTIDDDDYKIVAQGSNYTLTETDKERFSSDENYTPKLLDNSIAFANGEPHEHPICGDENCTEHGNALWIPLTFDAASRDLKYGTSTAARVDGTYNEYIHIQYTLPAGNYYLKEDIALPGSIRIDGDVNICLNGKTISACVKGDALFFLLENKLTVCDCLGGGKISVVDFLKNQLNAVYLGNASFDSYGGTITGAKRGVIGTGIVGLYGGTIIDNIQGVYGNSNLSLTIGGDVKITGNTERNVYLDYGQTVTIDHSLTQNARVGITTSSRPLANTKVQIATGADADLDYTQIFTPDVTDKNYVVTKDENGDLYLGIHQHHWVCSAEGAGIKFWCTADGCSLGKDFTTTYTIKAPADLTYSGNAKDAAVEVSEIPAGVKLPAISAIVYQKEVENGFVAFEGIPKDAGTYQATVSVTDSDNNTVTAHVTFTIEKAPLTVTADSRDITYGDAPAVGGVTYEGFVNGEDENSLTGTLTYSYDYKQYKNVGSYTITPGGLASDNYEITYVPGTLTVNQLEAELEWENTDNRTYDDSKGNITAKVTNPVNGDVINVIVSGGDELTTGTHTAEATGLTGDKADNYKLPDDATKEYTISEAAQTLTFIMSGDVTKAYGDGSFLNNASNDRVNGSTVTYSSSDTKVAVVDADGKVTIKGAGTATITASAAAVAGKYSAGEASYTLTVEKKTLTAADLEFTEDSTFTKIYDGSADCTGAAVQIKSDAKVDADDVLPVVAGTYAYNSANVKDAEKVTFTSTAADSDNYILPENLVLEHDASIEKAKQASLTITSTNVTYGTDLTLTVSGGSGNGEVTYTVENGSGAATVNGSTLHPVRAGEVTVTATKSGDDNYYDVTSQKTVITISKADYTDTVNKVVNIIKNRGTVQSGTLTAADFFPEGQMPDGAVISDVNGSFSAVVDRLSINTATGEISYTSMVNITAVNDESCVVTIASTNYKDITATLIFHPTDKQTVEISGLIYENKIYDGNVIKPTGALTVSGNKVSVDELEVRYECMNGATYDSPEAPVDAGTYRVTYKVADSNDDYIGSVEYIFIISPKTVTEDMIGTIDAQKYTGNAIKPEPAVKNGELPMISGKDFEYSYADNTKAGEATVTITGKGNYTGTASRTFTIEPKNISGASIVLDNDRLVYTGQTQEVQIISVTLDGVTLTADDYGIKGDTNKCTSAKDQITLTIEGKGNYTGTATTTWKITKADPTLENFDVTPDLATAQTYDGKPKWVTANVKSGVLGMGKVTVYYEGISGTDYARSQTAPVNAGKYKVIAVVADDGTNYNAKEIEIGTLTINKAAAPELEDIIRYYEFPQTGEQTVSIADLVPDVTGYELGTITGDTGMLSDVTVDADGIVKYTLNGTGKEGDTVTLPLTIRSANYEDTNINVVIALTMEYKIIEGANSTWKKNSKKDLVIRGNGEFAKFRDVKVDGEILDSENYTAESGSTVITLKASYLKTLSKGSHSFEILWEDGSAGTDFKIAANSSGSSHSSHSNNNSTADTTGSTAAPALVTSPKTGDDLDIWLILFVMSFAGTVGLLVRRKKLKNI